MPVRARTLHLDPAATTLLVHVAVRHGIQRILLEFLVKNPAEIYCMRDLRERSHPEDSICVSAWRREPIHVGMTAETRKKENSASERAYIS